MDVKSLNKRLSFEGLNLARTTVEPSRSCHAAVPQIRMFRQANLVAPHWYPYLNTLSYVSYLMVSLSYVGRRIEQLLVCLDSEGHSGR